MRVQAHLICAFFVRGCKEYANKALSQNPAIAILFERVYKSMPKRALGAGFDRNTWEEKQSKKLQKTNNHHTPSQITTAKNTKTKVFCSRPERCQDDDNDDDNGDDNDNDNDDPDNPFPFRFPFPYFCT